MDSGSTRLPRNWQLLLSFALVAGALLRLVWLQDMEWKYDEQFMFRASQAIGVSEPWPMLGMHSGVSLRNPALSIWVFVVLAKFFGIADPVSLARAVAMLNVAALGLLIVHISRFVRPREREPWVWATVIAAVNPLAVQIQRKIWAQSVLPVFCVLFLMSWSRRRTAWGAFSWGLIGACLGQIHMSGFFFAAAFVIWTFAFDRKSDGKEKIRWLPWLAGSIAGSVSLVPWILYVLQSPKEQAAKLPWSEVLQLKFWQHWALEPAGFHLNQSLGKEHFSAFARLPIFGDTPTYLIGAAHVALAGIGVFFLVSWAISLWKRRGEGARLWTGQGDETGLAQNAALWGFGGLLTSSRVMIHRHYLIIAFPLQFVWYCRMALTSARFGRTLLLIVCLLQLWISVGFLTYIHFNGGANGGDYGVSYSAQQGLSR